MGSDTSMLLCENVMICGGVDGGGAGGRSLALRWFDSSERLSRRTAHGVCLLRKSGRRTTANGTWGVPATKERTRDKGGRHTACACYERADDGQGRTAYGVWLLRRADEGRRMMAGRGFLKGNDLHRCTDAGETLPESQKVPKSPTRRSLHGSKGALHMSFWNQQIGPASRVVGKSISLVGLPKQKSHGESHTMFTTR
jgi:hypothetical protein